MTADNSPSSNIGPEVVHRTEAPSRSVAEHRWCDACGGHGAVMSGDRVNQFGRTVPRFVPCSFCDGRDRATPAAEQAGEERG